MTPLLDAVFIIIIAVLLDVVIGELPNSFHPLRWMGKIVDSIDRHTKRGNPSVTRIKGLLTYILILLIFGFVMFIILALVHHYLGEWPWIIVTALMLKLTFAISSFKRHIKPIIKNLDKGRIEKARQNLQMIVSRDTSELNEEHITSACVETMSENYVDSVVSPTLFFGIFGILGCLAFRCANLMDAMWGYMNEKYRDLGFVPAKLDDILGFIPARISPLFVLIGAFFLSMQWRNVFGAAKEEHGKTPSPNSGWPMAAFAGAMEIRMEKIGVYIIGKGRLPKKKDVDNCYHLLLLSSLVFIFLIVLPLYSIIGMNVQIAIENMILVLFGVTI